MGISVLLATAVAIGYAVTQRLRVRKAPTVNLVSTGLCSYEPYQSLFVLPTAR